MTRTGLMLLVGVAGCGDWFSEPAPPPPEDAYLVWSTNEEGGIQTVWLDSSGAAISVHDGLAIAAGETVWRMSRDPHPVDVLDCGCLMQQPDPFGADAPPAACVSKAPTEATVLRAADGRSVSLLTPTLDPWTGDPEFGLEFFGTVGPYVLLASHTSGYPCGAAHGFYSSDFSVVDLTNPAAGAQPIDVLLTQAELAQLAPDAAEKARQALLSADGGLEGLMDPEAPLSLTALLADWSSAGLSVTVQLTGDACYACSDGQWSAYTRSHRLSLPQLPQKLRAHSAAPPAPVVAWRSSKPADARWGFSVLRGQPASLAAARAQLP